jgi:hypothetical protein
MLQMKKSLLVVAAITAAFASSNAFALPGFKVGIMAGPNLHMPTVPALSGLEVSGGLGYAVGPSIGIGPLELSALYTSLSTKATASELSSTESSTFLSLPALMRFGAGPLSLGLGGFYSLSLEEGGGSNYGATGSVRITVPVLGAFVDARYDLGLKEESGVKSSSAAVLLGWNFL